MAARGRVDSRRGIDVRLRASRALFVARHDAHCDNRSTSAPVARDAPAPCSPAPDSAPGDGAGPRSDDGRTSIASGAPGCRHRSHTPPRIAGWRVSRRGRRASAPSARRSRVGTANTSRRPGLGGARSDSGPRVGTGRHGQSCGTAPAIVWRALDSARTSASRGACPAASHAAPLTSIPGARLAFARHRAPAARAARADRVSELRRCADTVDRTGDRRGPAADRSVCTCRTRAVPAAAPAGWR